MVSRTFFLRWFAILTGALLLTIALRISTLIIKFFEFLWLTNIRCWFALLIARIHYQYRTLYTNSFNVHAFWSGFLLDVFLVYSCRRHDISSQIFGNYNRNENNTTLWCPSYSQFYLALVIRGKSNRTLVNLNNGSHVQMSHYDAVVSVSVFSIRYRGIEKYATRRQWKYLCTSLGVLLISPTLKTMRCCWVYWRVSPHQGRATISVP